MPLGIKSRQVAGVTAIVGATIVVLGVLHLSALARVLLEESRARGELLTNAVYHRARLVVSERGSDTPYAALGADSGLQSILESSIYSKNVTYAAIVDTRGIVVAHSDPARVAEELPGAGHFDDLLARGRLGLLSSVYLEAGRTVEVEQPLLLEQQSFGSIRVGVSTLLVSRELERALGAALLTLTVALVVAVLIATLLAQRLLRPIHIIRSGLTRLGRGEFGSTLDLKQPDGLGDYLSDIGVQLSGEQGSAASAHNREQVLQVLNYSRKLTALSRLSAGIAHEVKNPLNAMTIHLELLRLKLATLASAVPRPTPTLLQAGEGGGVAVADSPAEVADALRHAGVIGDEIARLDHVLQGFLKFTRPEELKPEAVSVKTLMDEVAGLIEEEARQTRVRVVVECPPGVPPIHADSDMIRQALLNLARNACQAMPEGGTLALGCGPAGDGRVQITVTDTGVGIQPDDLNRIFNLYFTTKAEGSGIGLSLVYRIVQMHDGDVEVESAPGRGSTFRLLLPTAPLDEA